MRTQHQGNTTRGRLSATFLALTAFFLGIGMSAQLASAKVMGTVKSVNGNIIVLTTDSGAEVTVTLANGARIIHAGPGQDLKTAPQIQVSDIQVGDRVLAAGPAEGQSSGTATMLLVMKQSDIADIHQRELEEWRHGVGGIVKEVDPSAGTITVLNSLAAGGKPIVIHLPANTNIQRYSPDSVKFDDAKPSTLDQIKPGDQVRARGTKNEDGTEFIAKAVVSGSFKDVAGTVVSTDATNNTVTIMDLATKKPITIKVGPDSLLRKLPPFVAMGIAMRLKGGEAGAGAAAGGGWQGRGQGQTQGQGAAQGGAVGGNWRGGGAGGYGGGGGDKGGTEGGPGGGGWRGNGGGPPDFQQMLARMPAVTIADLNKGDAVMLVATEGTAISQPTAITLLAGVEAILTSAPAGTTASTILSPWNLGQSGAAASGGDSTGQ